MLNELGQKISNALTLINNAETIDEKVCIADFRSPELQLMPRALHADASQSTSAAKCTDRCTAASIKTPDPGADDCDRGSLPLSHS